MAIPFFTKRRKRRKQPRRPVRNRVPRRKRRRPATAAEPAAKPAVKPAAQPAAKPASGPGSSWSTAAPVATARERLYLNRLGTGFTPRSLAQLRALGGPEAWLAAQLSPGTVPESPKVGAIDSWFSDQRLSPAEKHATSAGTGKKAWQYGNDLGNWTILRRVYSERAVLERMVDFWSSVMHIPIGHDRAWVYRFDYDATLREHAVGRFEDILTACSLHPAMRVYLDNYRSVRNKPNENQGRELLELHSVGRGAGYSEAMVKASAILLSGYTVDWGKTFEPRYDTGAHTTGPVQVLGFSHANGSSDGQAATAAYLTYLAHHPATAKYLMTKLTRFFVSDSPSDGLVNRLAAVYLDSGTDMAVVLKALATSPEFLSSEGLKVRTPVDDLVATARALQVDVQAAKSNRSWANAANYLHGADRLFSWPRPDGPPITGRPWSSASRLFASYDMHRMQAGGWYPDDAVYREYGSWLPVASLRFDAYVDHLCRTWLGRASDARLLKAACQAVDARPETTINAKHPVARWMFPQLCTALLDTPDHMTT